MKTTILLIFLFFSVPIISQQKKLKEYSHTQFFKMIAAEKDSVFKLTDAIIRYTPQDSLFSYRKIKENFVFDKTDTIIVNKHIDLDNVHFEHQYDLSEFGFSDDKGQAIPHVIFNKNIFISNTSSIVFYNCVFKGDVSLYSYTTSEEINQLQKAYIKYQPSVAIYNSEFYKNVSFFIGNNNTFSPLTNMFSGNKISSKNRYSLITLSISNIDNIEIEDNDFDGNGLVDMYLSNASSGTLNNNNFNEFRVNLIKESKNKLQLFETENNTFKKPPLLSVNQFSTTDVYNWNQWKNSVSAIDGFYTYLDNLMVKDDRLEFGVLSKNDSIFNAYQTVHRHQIEKSYKFEMKLLGQFYDFYKLQHDSDYANQVYIEFKNLETKRSKYIYKQNPNFDSFFNWKINQFLKIFSGYGTNPSLSIIFSLYVIFIFAFVYMLFPNNWETGKKNKLMNRLQFFTKYFRQDEGIREIYEEERQHDVMSYTEFRDYMHHSKKEIPNFFIWLTRPIYYFSSYNYKITGRVLKYTDILKGRWVDLPKRKKAITSIIIGSWMFLLILIDVLIKFLNALTLSINTFTTLGFGEIPIKGLPRYLAIIQGFIGWFMLTIFSVSLISQLLN